MKLLALLFLAAFVLASQANAYATAGAYERLWYYYVYLVDTNGGKDPAEQIAKNCWKDAGNKKGKPCTFNQFIKYIAKADTNRPATDFEVTRDTAPDVSETAKKLESMRLTGEYIVHLIHPGASGQGASGVSNLMTQLTSYMDGKMPETPQPYRDALHKTMLAVARARQEASLKAAKDALKTRGFNLVTHQAPVLEGSSDMMEQVDLRATLQASPGKGRQDFHDAWRQTGVGPDKAHKSCFQAAQEAVKRFSYHCQ